MDRRKVGTYMRKCSKILGLIMAVVMIVGVLPVGVFADKIDVGGGGGGGGGTPGSDGYVVYAYAGVVTVESGVYIDGKAKEGSVLSIFLDQTAFPGKTFSHWVGSDGTKVPQAAFRLLVDQDVWFYPVFSDLSGAFGDWTLVFDGDCEEGKVYMREDPVTGLREYKKQYVNWGQHDFSNYEYVDENTCAAVCVICGKRVEDEHCWSSEVTVLEATHDHGGTVRKTCWNCGATVDVSTPMTAEHVWDADGYGGNWEIVTEAKDGQPGVRRRHCLYCEAYEDYWYIRAEWEKYYFGNKVWYDSSESVSLTGTDDELHYNFINDEGYDTYVYAVREDYRDNYQSYVFMWIDHADALGRKALYLAKSKGHDDRGYYAYRGFDWAIVGYLDSKEAFISEIDHLSCGYDRYSSGFFDLVVKYEKYYNQSMIPIDEDPSFMAHHPEWVYETSDGQYALHKDGETGISYIPYKYNDARYFMHVDPETNVCIDFWEPNSSSHRASIRAVQAIVRPDEYAALEAAFTPDTPVFPTIEYPEVQQTDAGHTHVYDLTSNDWLPYDENQHICFCAECGAPIYWGHAYSNVIDIDLDDPRASTKKRVCSCGYFKDHRLNVMSTDGIANEIKTTFQRISAITTMTVDVSHTPTPKNFQMRVNYYYYADGPYAADPSSAPYDNRFRWYGSSAPWQYGYEVTDWFSFGIVRTENTPAGYMNYSGGNTFFVQPNDYNVENYEFVCWEIYDWATESWVFFSSEKTPRFNEVSWEGDYHTATEFTLDTRLTDMTLLRCVREYVEPEPVDPAVVEVIGGTCYASGHYEEAAATGTFPAGTTVYFDSDYDLVPEGKRFEGWRIEKDGVIVDECSYAWGVTLESGSYLFTAVYVNAQYYIQVEGENGYVYLDAVNGESGTTGKTGKIGKGEGDGESEPFWGGEYELGTTLTMHTEGEDGYPYFYGWYLQTWGKEDGDSEEELLDTNTTFTYTVTGELEGRITAKWGETEEMPIDWHDVTVVDGFGYREGMRQGVRVSALRLSNYSSFTVIPDPTDRLDVTVWTMTGEDFEAEAEPWDAAGHAAFYVEESMPYLLTVTPTGSAHVHVLEEYEAVAATCTGYGNIAYWYCEGCESGFSDANATNEVTYEEVLLDPLGHDFGNWIYVDENMHSRVCSRCGETESERHASSEWIACGAEGHCMHCPLCDDDYALLMHRYTSEVTVRPTTATTGEIVYTCALCGYSYTEVLPVTSGELDYVYVPELFHTYDGHPALYDLHEITAYDEYGEVTPDYASFTVFIEQNGVQTQTTVDPDTFVAVGPTEVGEYYIVVKAPDGEGGYVEIARIYCAVVPAEGTPEDINGDGDVDITDVTALIGILTAGGGTAANVGDLNGNQEVDIGDVTTLLNYLANA